MMKQKHAVIPIFIPHKGCPFDCIFCNQKRISGQIEDVIEAGMLKTIQEHLSSISKDAFVEIGFYGGSFTGIDKALQQRYLEIANRFIKSGEVREIRLSTRPDYINDEILEMLERLNVRTIELGVQSLDSEVLERSQRGHSTEDVYKSSQLIKKYGFNLGIQTMVGLPGDTMEKSIATARKVAGILPAMVRIYPALVIRDTYLEKLYDEGQYHPLLLDTAVEVCAALLDIYNQHHIQVIRIGLQPTDNINQDMDVIAGPFHPAFRQLVESRLVLVRIEKIIEERNLYKKDSITISTHSRNISNVIGQKKINILYLKKKYHFKQIYVQTVSSQEVGHSNINMLNII